MLLPPRIRCNGNLRWLYSFLPSASTPPYLSTICTANSRLALGGVTSPVAGCDSNKLPTILPIWTCPAYKYPEAWYAVCSLWFNRPAHLAFQRPVLRPGRVRPIVLGRPLLTRCQAVKSGLASPAGHLRHASGRPMRTVSLCLPASHYFGTQHDAIYKTGCAVTTVNSRIIMPTGPIDEVDGLPGDNERRH